MGAALHELVQLTDRAIVLPHAPKRFAEPETHVTREQRRHAAGRQRGPRRHGVVRAAERVVREPEAVTRPGLQRVRRRREELSERVAGARPLAEPERGPAAAVQAPHRELGRARTLRDLTEELVRLLEAIEPVIGLGEPVPGLRDQLALRALARRLLEILRGVLVLALGVVRAPALERLRRDAECRPDARERARRRQRRGRLVRRRHRDGRQGHRRQLGGRRRQRQVEGRDRRLLDRRFGERHEVREIGRRWNQRQQRRRRRRARPGEERGRQRQRERAPDHWRLSPVAGAGGLASRPLIAVARLRAQSRSSAFGLFAATAS